MPLNLTNQPINNLFDPKVRPYQMLPLRARVDLGAMSINKIPALLEPHHQIFSCHMQNTRWGSLTILQRCSWCILQPQLTGPKVVNVWINTDLRISKFYSFKLSDMFVKIICYQVFSSKKRWYLSERKYFKRENEDSSAKCSRVCLALM